MDCKSSLLVIFDLDQTLVDAIPLYDRACRKSFAEVFGTSCSVYELDFAGKTLPAIIWEGCRKKGVSRSEYEKKLPIAIKHLIRHFNRFLESPKSKIRVLPGVRRLLSSLSKSKVPMCVVTGSAEASAQKILSKAGLSEHLLFVVGGERARDKRQGIAIAIKDFERATGRRAKNVVFIADSPREAADALDEKIAFIGTATGFHTKAQLNEAGAKKAFPDLSDTKDVLDAIFSLPIAKMKRRSA